MFLSATGAAAAANTAHEPLKAAALAGGVEFSQHLENVAALLAPDVRGSVASTPNKGKTEAGDQRSSATAPGTQSDTAGQQTTTSSSSLPNSILTAIPVFLPPRQAEITLKNGKQQEPVMQQDSADSSAPDQQGTTQESAPAADNRQSPKTSQREPMSAPKSAVPSSNLANAEMVPTVVTNAPSVLPARLQEATLNATRTPESKMPEDSSDLSFSAAPSLLSGQRTSPGAGQRTLVSASTLTIQPGSGTSQLVMPSASERPVTQKPTPQSVVPNAPQNEVSAAAAPQPNRSGTISSEKTAGHDENRIPTTRTGPSDKTQALTQTGQGITAQQAVSEPQSIESSQLAAMPLAQMVITTETTADVTASSNTPAAGNSTIAAETSPKGSPRGGQKIRENLNPAPESPKQSPAGINFPAASADKGSTETPVSASTTQSSSPEANTSPAPPAADEPQFPGKRETLDDTTRDLKAGGATITAESSRSENELAFAARIQPAEAVGQNSANSGRSKDQTPVSASPAARRALVEPESSHFTPAVEPTALANSAPASGAQAGNVTNVAAENIGTPFQQAQDSTPPMPSSAASQTNPTPAAAPEIQAPQSEQTISAAKPLRDVSLRIEQPQGQNVEIRLVEKAGEVHVAVRAADSDVAQGLRQNLSELSDRLSESGFHAETWRPTTADSSASSSENRNPSGNSGNGDSQQQQGWSQQGRGQRDQNQSNRPFWVQEFETSLTGSAAPTGQPNGLTS